MKKLAFTYSILLSAHCLFSQIIPDSITIVRDKWGVPHIFARTDEEVSYGLAWATAEDDFFTIQDHLLTARSRLSAVNGKESAPMDVFSFLLDADVLIDSLYSTALSPKFRKIIEAYAQAINTYAKKHPEEIRLKGIFPVTPRDFLKSYMLGSTLTSHVHFEIMKIFKGLIKNFEDELKQPNGSNALAVSKAKTTDGKTYLAINSHQPLEGPWSWYEAHLCSEEGLNILGANFPGGVTLFTGVNENIGWAHTLNFVDLTDVYKLTMHPEDKLKYKFDGKWETLEERTLKLKIKLFPGIRMPVKKTFYRSKYGTVIKNKDGYYAVRFPANMDIRSAEQWYHMSKATNYKEFHSALQIQGLTSTNIVYADRQHNIFYICNAKLPHRNPGYNWKKVLPGDTSATLWKPLYTPIDSLPQYMNPSCGYLFNTNNASCNATCPAQNLNPAFYTTSWGYFNNENNRSLRLQHLIGQYDKLSYEDFKKIKYDAGYMNPIYTFSMENIETILHLNGAKYPDIADIISLISKWDRMMDKENTAAAAVLISMRHILEYVAGKGKFYNDANTIPEEVMIESLHKAKKHLLKYFGTIRVPFGKVQVHAKGDKEMPIAGGPEVLAAMHCKPYKDGKMKAWAGESYISLVKFSEKGVEVETINAYGASNRKDSPHYTDQMELFSNQKLKPMTLDKQTIFREAEKIYHPK